MRIQLSFIQILFICLSINLFAQKPNQNILVEYESYLNNKLVNQDNPIMLISNLEYAFLYQKKHLDVGFEDYPYEQSYIDFKNQEYLSLAQLDLKSRIKTVATNRYTNFQLNRETKKIAGYTCKKATIEINSNKYTLWYTNAIKAKGSPLLLGSNLGLVLEIDRNGTYKITAKKITQNLSIDINPYLKLEGSKMVDQKLYKKKVWESRFKTIPLFENDLVNYSDTLINKPNLQRFAKGTLLVTKVKFPKINNTDQVFVNLTEQSNGDAYDRAGSLFLIPYYHEISLMDALEKGLDILPVYQNKESSHKYQGVVATNNYTPPIELMRFFTPFGVKGFNHIEVLDYQWQDKAFYRQEITEFASLISNSEWYIGVYIGNYDKGGHKISADITIHPNGSKQTEVINMMPLFNTTNVMEMEGQNYPTMFASSEGLKIEFTATTDMKNVRLRYITTGHGGWANGDEFNPKPNTILLNNSKVLDYLPWRQDCGSYRDYNPASGNFETGLSSSDLSRSNWCPGTITPPIWIPLGDIPKGTHTLQIKIPMGKPEGKNLSYWNISGVLFSE
ncbi:GLPGLI family protein [Myroides phaeus]|uniref:GLPGLI family protein n=1 Tax=Myroides phaeus TaxID=702745 RepID=A0A1G8BL87_9FLAO|nr:GLPGLI family protein [Myroides phaeus]SDH33868.1 GLPGLI family protein [Myroides phaeus]